MYSAAILRKVVVAKHPYRSIYLKGILRTLLARMPKTAVCVIRPTF